MKQSETRYQATCALLQVTFSVDIYRGVLAKYRRGQDVTMFSKHSATADYWQGLPTYLIARCPLCNEPYTAVTDTHSLEGWVPHPELYRAVYHRDHQYIGCQHFVGVQTFVNLRGHQPTELAYYTSQLDVPFITPTLVPADLPAIAVMHSLPICRFDGMQFVPMYEAFTITYYAESPVAIRERRREENIATIADDPSFFPTMFYSNSEASTHPEAFDLALWVQRGKLAWLDLFAPDLPLRFHSSDTFPYAGIEGFRRHIAYRGGALEMYI